MDNCFTMLCWLLPYINMKPAMGIRMSPPSWTSLHLPPHPISPGCHRAPKFELLAAYSKFPLAICFTYGNVYVSTLLSQFVPPSPSPNIFTSLFSMSVSPFMHAKSLQLCLTLCDLMDCSPPGSSVHGISQARILEWVTISSSRGASQPRGWTHISCISCIGSRFFTTEPPGKPINALPISSLISYNWNLSLF